MLRAKLISRFDRRGLSTLVALALLGSALTPSASAQDGSASSLPVFVDGQAQIVDAFKDKSLWIQHDLFVETEFDSDGDGKRDRMHVDVTRPAQTENGLQLAVIYNSSPYFSGTAGGKQFFWNPEHELGEEPPKRTHPPGIKFRERRTIMSGAMINTWVPRGFIVVHSASPGTGLSEGCPTVGGQNESLAPKAVIDWLNGRAKGYKTLDGKEEVVAYWTTGKVGMTGTSYNGTIPLAAATTGVEGLEVIIPVSPNTSYYHYYRSYGLVRHPGGWMGEDIDVLYDFINSGDPAGREWCDCNIRDEEMLVNHDRVNGDHNEWWAARDYLNQLDKVKAATLMAHGFNDWNVMPEHSVRIYEALNAKGTPCAIFLHQGGHGGEPPHEQMNRWFSHYLYGVDNGVEDDPKSWVVREGARRGNPSPYEDYPHPLAEDVTLHLGKGGSALGSLRLKAGKRQGQEQLEDDVAVSGSELAKATKSKHRLIYATPELEGDVHLSGYAKVSIKLSSSAPAANLSVWLVSLPWTRSRSINDNIITRGWADPQNHSSQTEGEPLEPGKYYTVNFDLQPDDQIIPAGQRIGLMIFSSDRDFTLWPEAGTVLSVDLDGTSLTLPVVGGKQAMQAAIGK